MTSRIKLLGRMDVVEKRRPLDGRIKTRRPDMADKPGGEVEMRLSTLPTAFGEKMVMRIFDPEAAVKNLAGAGLRRARSQGLAGTDHAAARHHPGHRPHGQRQDDHAVQHAQDAGHRRGQRLHHRRPDRDDRAGLNQTQVQPQLDFGFAEGLRALMRQDPDIIMVGEIRDLATAEMAIQAALTGHLVFSTLHTNDAVGASRAWPTWACPAT
jgi:general secretion pathway protein E